MREQEPNSSAWGTGTTSPQLLGKNGRQKKEVQPNSSGGELSQPLTDHAITVTWTLGTPTSS